MFFEEEGFCLFAFSSPLIVEITEEIFTKSNLSNAYLGRDTLKGKEERVELGKSTCCLCDFNTFFQRSQHVVSSKGTGYVLTV